MEQKNYKYLSDYVNVIDGPIVTGIRAKRLDKSNFTYPLKYDDIKEEELSKAVKIQKGDIIYSEHAKDKSFYLYNLDNNYVYVDAENYKILRCKDEKYRSYIVNYLNDKDAQIHTSTDIKHIKETKVTIPTDNMLYIADKIQKFQMNRDEITMDEMNDIIRESNETSYYKKAAEEVCKLKEATLEAIIEYDRKELNICLENGAYKSVIILCGSILEAFLLDWITEYTKENLRLPKAIDKLKGEILKLNNGKKWDKESEEASDIWTQRQIIHPNIYIEKQNEINKETCEQIIKKLNYVLDSKQEVTKKHDSDSIK